MATYSDDIRQEIPDPTVYERAVDVLRFISRQGFSEELWQRERKQICAFRLGQDDMLPACLVQVAAQLTDPDIAVDIDVNQGTMALQFPQTSPKPPVRVMRENLKKVQEYFLGECVMKDATLDRYIIANPKKLPINPIAVVLRFIRDDEQCEPKYYLPTKHVFIDKAHLRHAPTSLVSMGVMQEYLATHLPGATLHDFCPDQLAIAPVTLTRIVDQLGLGPVKGALRN